MPTYEYACTECDHDFEITHGFNDPAPETCEICGGPLRKVFHPVGIVFKGSGFYKTDSRSPSKSTSGASGGDSSKSSRSDGSGSDSAKSDTKKAADKPAKDKPSGASSGSSGDKAGSSAKSQSD